MYNYLYSRPLWVIVVAMIGSILLWPWLGSIVRTHPKYRRAWMAINRILLLLVLCAILYTTLMTRKAGLPLVFLKPFTKFATARIQPELYREMLMNIFLFFPLGLTLSNSLPQRLNRWVRIGITTLFACLLSTVIEYTQYHFSLGVAETDDVICNALGAFIGSTSLIIAHAIENIRKGHGTP